MDSVEHRFFLGLLLILRRQFFEYLRQTFTFYRHAVRSREQDLVSTVGVPGFGSFTAKKKEIILYLFFPVETPDYCFDRF